MKYGMYYNESYLQTAINYLEELGNTTGIGSWSLPDSESKWKDTADGINVYTKAPTGEKWGI